MRQDGWYNRSELQCLQTGDVILTPSLIPGTDIVVPTINHVGIIGKVCGMNYIFHIPWGKTPILESLEIFEQKRKIVSVLRNDDTQKLTDEQLINNYHAVVGKTYSFFGHNCEDFIRCMTKDTVDIGFDQRCGYACILAIILVLIFFLYLIRKK